MFAQAAHLFINRCRSSIKVGSWTYSIYPLRYPMLYMTWVSIIYVIILILLSIGQLLFQLVPHFCQLFSTKPVKLVMNMCLYLWLASTHGTIMIGGIALKFALFLSFPILSCIVLAYIMASSAFSPYAYFFCHTPYCCIISFWICS